MTDTIYLNNDYSKVVDVAGWIGCYGAELDTIERLMVMGYRYSNHVNLGERADWLDKRIEQLKTLKRDWPCRG